MNTKLRMRRLRPAAQRGLSLIELMVAMALGVVLLLGLVQIFASVRAAFASGEGISRVQESGRFALEFLRRDSRMVGHLGCLNEYGSFLTTTSERFFFNHAASGTLTNTTGANGFDTAPYSLLAHRGVEVYDYSANGGTSPGNTLATALQETPALATAATQWTPNLPAGLTSTTTGSTNLLAAGAGAVVVGSDIVVLRYFDPNTISLPVGGGGVTQATGVIGVPSGAGIQTFGIYGLTSCKNTSLFQVTAAGGTTATAQGGAINVQNWHALENYGNGSMMFRYRSAIYYIGRNANNAPALFRRVLTDAPTSNAAGANYVQEELVEGVENMQVLLGVDTSGDRDDIIDQYRSASAHMPAGSTAQQIYDAQVRILSLRYSLMVRSPDRSSTMNPTSTTRMVGDVVLTPPLDNRMRQTYDNTVTLRNRVRN